MKLSGEGAKNVTTAGTPVAIGTAVDQPIEAIMVTAKSANTGVIYFGNSSVLASTYNGTPIVAGQTMTFPLGGGDLDTCYIDATVSGEGVSYTYYTV